jgi:hypothetical protein
MALPTVLLPSASSTEQSADTRVTREVAAVGGSGALSAAPPPAPQMQGKRHGGAPAWTRLGVRNRLCAPPTMQILPARLW